MVQHPLTQTFTCQVLGLYRLSGGGATALFITALANGWYRVGMTFTATGSATSSVSIRPIQSGSEARATTLTWAGGRNLYPLLWTARTGLWFFQLHPDHYRVCDTLGGCCVTDNARKHSVCVGDGAASVQDASSAKCVWEQPNRHDGYKRCGRNAICWHRSQHRKLLITSTGLVGNASLLSASALTVGSVVCVAFRWGNE